MGDLDDLRPLGWTWRPGKEKAHVECPLHCSTLSCQEPATHTVCIGTEEAMGTTGRVRAYRALCKGCHRAVCGALGSSWDVRVDTREINGRVEWRERRRQMMRREGYSVDV